jgi:hypothetical protein
MMWAHDGAIRLVDGQMSHVNHVLSGFGVINVALGASAGAGQREQADAGSVERAG